MDINEYITSGSIENYVLGIASDQERQEVECMSHIYPEIKTALTEFQLSIENLALKAAVSPPASLKVKVLEQIKSEKQEGTAKETKVVSISKPEVSASTSKWTKFLAAASVILLLGLGFYANSLKSDLNNAETELAQNEASYELMSDFYDASNDQNQSLSEELTALSDQMAFIRDQNTTRINLAGTAGNESNLATVFWNTNSEKVMLDVQNLPITTSEESYQLWVLVDGLPIDMGVFDYESVEDTAGLMEMKTTGLADAFAITLEPKGGSESPTLEQLQVIGNI